MRIKGFLRFNGRRWGAFGAILALVYALAHFGIWIAFFAAPLGLGGPIFTAALVIWYIPGIVFFWTGLFRFIEFGAEPLGWPGHVLMFVFYVGVAALLSWPLGPRRKRAP